ncbi:hypothetical protein CCS05_12865 (plasmid) [Levilactobacillus brevis]|uniref:hypothetical protein n=1 Tax=Levilactobacillus brevis TaxID=1580 RepID=UPI000D7285E7|nr:hypothetical protein [Levilactobacillus brevis]AWP47804.1 hypothetical protein CCS05_12865 [Levilactobacillus brevis]
MKKKTAWIIIGVIVAIIVVGNVGWFVHTQQHSQSSSSNRSGMMGGRSGSSGHSMMGGNSSGRASEIRIRMSHSKRRPLQRKNWRYRQS